MHIKANIDELECQHIDPKESNIFTNHCHIVLIKINLVYMCRGGPGVAVHTEHWDPFRTYTTSHRGEGKHLDYSDSQKSKKTQRAKKKMQGL